MTENKQQDTGESGETNRATLKRRDVISVLAATGGLAAVGASQSGASGGTGIGGGPMSSDAAHLQVELIQGEFSERPSAGVENRVFRVDDPADSRHGEVYKDDGESWNLIQLGVGSVSAEQLNNAEYRASQFDSLRAAFDQLTSGSWEQLVIDETDSAPYEPTTADLPLKLPSKTVLVVREDMRLPDGMQTEFIANENSNVESLTDSDIHIIGRGGTIDGNKANLSDEGDDTTQIPVFLQAAERTSVRGLTVRNCIQHGIFSAGCHDCRVKGNYILDTEQRGIFFTPSKPNDDIRNEQITVTGNTLKRTAQDTDIAGALAVQGFVTATISHNIVKETNAIGISLSTEDAGRDSKHGKIVDNTVTDVRQGAIVAEAREGGDMTDIRIEDNIVNTEGSASSRGHGIIAAAEDTGTFDGVAIVDNTVRAARDGIFFDARDTNARLKNYHVKENDILAAGGTPVRRREVFDGVVDNSNTGFYNARIADAERFDTLFERTEGGGSVDPTFDGSLEIRLPGDSSSRDEARAYNTSLKFDPSTETTIRFYLSNISIDDDDAARFSLGVGDTPDIKEVAGSDALFVQLLGNGTVEAQIRNDDSATSSDDASQGNAFISNLKYCQLSWDGSDFHAEAYDGETMVSLTRTGTDYPDEPLFLKIAGTDFGSSAAKSVAFDVDEIHILDRFVSVS